MFTLCFYLKIAAACFVPEVPGFRGVNKLFGSVLCGVLEQFQMLLAPRIQGMAAMVKQKDTKRLIAKVAMITLYIIKFG